MTQVVLELVRKLGVVRRDLLQDGRRCLAELRPLLWVVRDARAVCLSEHRRISCDEGMQEGRRHAEMRCDQDAGCYAAVICKGDKIVLEESWQAANPVPASLRSARWRRSTPQFFASGASRPDIRPLSLSAEQTDTLTSSDECHSVFPFVCTPFVARRLYT